MARPKTDARDRLLMDAVDYLAARGVSDVSLRDVASGLGTSTRMLVFHFGSKEQLLVEIARVVEARQRESLLAMMTAGRPDQPAAALRSLWHRLLEPELAPFERLFFELYGQGLQNRPHAIAFLDGIVESWLGPVAELFVRVGQPRDCARREARLAVAVVRGLLLDVLATGELAPATAAFESYVARFETVGAIRTP